ncbi:formyltetrahydrofolate deformylase, partial [Acinetobacter chengduensis]
MLQSNSAQYILKIRCPAASGIVAAISGCLANNG